MAAVSYTHLDVYKRQAESIEESGEAADRQGEITVRTIAPASIEIVEDVYKRQE